MDINVQTIHNAVNILLSMGVSVENIDSSDKSEGSIFDKLTYALTGETSPEYCYKLYQCWHSSNIFKSTFIDKYGIADSTIDNIISYKVTNKVKLSNPESLRGSKVFNHLVGLVEIDKNFWMEPPDYDLAVWQFTRIKLREIIATKFNVICNMKFLGIRHKKGRFANLSNMADYSLCTYKGCCMKYRIDYFIPPSVGVVKIYIRSNYDIDTITHNSECNEILNSRVEKNKGPLEEGPSQQLKGWQSDMEENFPCLDNDIFIDMTMLLELEKDKKSNIIQCIGLPLQIDLFSHERLEIIKYEYRLTMHLSCSANIGKSPVNESGKLLYYSGVVDNIKGSYLPVLEFFVLDKDNFTINSCLTNFLRFCSTVVLAWPFNRIVVDYSRVMIWSVLSVWNSTNLVSYMNDAYRLITVNNYDVSNNFAIYTTVHICTSSLLKSLLDILKSNCAENVSHKQFYLHVMAAIIDSKRLDDILKIFESLVIISKSSYKHDVFEKHLVSLKCFMINIDSVLFDSIINTCQDRESFCEEFDQNVTLDNWWQAFSDENLFYKLFREKFDNALCQINETEQLAKNRLINNDNYKFDAFCDILLNRYMGILPLWSCILYRELRYLDSHLTNDPVQRYHQSIKQYIPHELSDLPLGYLIRKIRHKNDALFKNIKI